MKTMVTKETKMTQDTVAPMVTAVLLVSFVGHSSPKKPQTGVSGGGVLPVTPQFLTYLA